MSFRRAVIGSVAVLGVVIGVGGAAAFACITPASLTLSTASGRPSDVITVSGSSFRLPENATTGVQIRWHTPDGRVLAEVRPDDAGTFTTTITVPDGPPGYYVVTAVLRDASGNDAPGTPGRALFEVRGAPAPSAPPAVARTFTPSAGASNSFPLALVVGLGAVGLVLFTAGFVAVVRDRRGKAATPAAVRRD